LRLIGDDPHVQGTQKYSALRRGEEYERDCFATRETVTLSPLPCWEHLPPEEQKKKIAGLVRGIEEEAAAQREATGKPVLGPRRLSSSS